MRESKGKNQDSNPESFLKVILIGGMTLLWFHLRAIICDSLGIEPEDEKPFG